jgi:hypothetical protein
MVWVGRSTGNIFGIAGTPRFTRLARPALRRLQWNICPFHPQVRDLWTVATRKRATVNSWRKHPECGITGYLSDNDRRHAFRLVKGLPSGSHQIGILVPNPVDKVRHDCDVEHKHGNLYRSGMAVDLINFKRNE